MHTTLSAASQFHPQSLLHFAPFTSYLNSDYFIETSPYSNRSPTRTNYAIQKLNENFVFNTDESSSDVGGKWYRANPTRLLRFDLKATLFLCLFSHISPRIYINHFDLTRTLRAITALAAWMEQHGYDFEKLWHNIQQVIIKTMLAGHAALNHNYRLFFPRTADANCCFQILGFDIMLDEDLDPWVIEVNRSPSLATDTVRLPQILRHCFLFMRERLF